MFSNSARVGGDINPSWPHITGMIDTDEPLAPWAGPGFWNDNDSESLQPGYYIDVVLRV